MDCRNWNGIGVAVALYDGSCHTRLLLSLLILPMEVACIMDIRLWWRNFMIICMMVMDERACVRLDYGLPWASYSDGNQRSMKELGTSTAWLVTFRDQFYW